MFESFFDSVIHSKVNCISIEALSHGNMSLELLEIIIPILQKF